VLTAYVIVQSLVTVLGGRLGRRRADERGQASAEYALVLLGAAAVALLVTAWAARTNRVGRLLDGVMDQLLSRVK
jgi:Flp pilus assembly pilin Flp